MLEIFGRMNFSGMQIGQILAEADFITVDLVGVLPDAMLRQFRIVELCPHAIRVVVHTNAAE